MIVEINDSFIETKDIIHISPIYVQDIEVCSFVGFYIWIKDHKINIRETVMGINRHVLDDIKESVNKRRIELVQHWLGDKELIVI